MSEPDNDSEKSDSEEQTISWGELLVETEGRLTAGGHGDATYCARLITEEVVGYEGAEFILALSEPATVRGVAQLDAMVARCLMGEPIQYVIGHWPFRDLDLFIDNRVLIPRPETEVVAGIAIDLAKDMPSGSVVVDLGTGSGAIGLSVASEVAESRVWLTDNSTHALDIARANLAGLGPGATNVRIAQGFWFDALPEALRGEVAVIVSNPPYVATSDELGSGVRDWEPANALLAGDDGLDDLKLLVAQARSWLTPSGALVLELAPWQAFPVGEMCGASFANVEIVKDLAGLDRVVVAKN